MWATAAETGTILLPLTGWLPSLPVEDNSHAFTSLFCQGSRDAMFSRIASNCTESHKAQTTMHLAQDKNAKLLYDLNFMSAGVLILR